jgi:hypothetical protein
MGEEEKRRRLLKFAPVAVIKGDYVGHPFRGNQWTDASGVSRQPAESMRDMSRAGQSLNPTDDPLVAETEGRPFEGFLDLSPETQAMLDARDAYFIRVREVRDEAKRIVGEKEAKAFTTPDALFDEAQRIDPSFAETRKDAVYTGPNVYKIVDKIKTDMLLAYGAKPLPEGETAPTLYYAAFTREESGRLTSEQRTIDPKVDVTPLRERGMSDQQIGELVHAVEVKANRLLDGPEVRSAQFGQSVPDQIAAERKLIPVLEEELKNARVSVTVTPRILSNILADERFKTQFETGKSRGYNSTQARQDEELARFGYPTQMPADKRPVYGMIEVGGLRTPSERGNLQYGNVLVVLKPEVADRTTFSADDSLSNYRPSAPLREPNTRGILSAFVENTHTADEIRSGEMYLEAQVHGGVKLSDIGMVIFESGVQIENRSGDKVKTATAPSAALLKRLEKAGIPYQIVTSGADIKPVEKAVGFDPTLLIKGDYVGHPFRGNQWTDASGVSRRQAMSGADRSSGIANLQAVDTVEEARATGRPLKILQPEHYPPQVKAALAAHRQAQDAINALHEEIVGQPETEEATKRFYADRRVQVAELALQLALDEARVQLTTELAKKYGFTVEQNPEAPYERIPYENVWRDPDGRLKREEAYFYPSKFAEGYRWTAAPLTLLNPDGSYRLVYQGENKEQKLGYESFYGIPIESLRTGKPPFSSYDASGNPDQPQQDQKAVDAARQILIKEAKDLGIDLPETTQPPRLSAKNLKGSLSDDDIGVLGSHIFQTGMRAFLGETKEIDTTLSWTDPKGDVTATLIARQGRLVTDDAPLSVTVPANKVGAILKDGRLKSQFETGRSGGKNDPEIRADWEAAMFGYPRGMNPEQRPIYGMVETGGPKPSSTRGNEQYGTVTLVLKDDVKDRATFTNGDSLNMNRQFVPVRDPSSRLAQERVSGRMEVGDDNDTYYETQIHGGVKTSDIAKVIIDTRTYKDFKWISVPPSAALLKSLDKAGIPYEIVAGKNFQDPEAHKSATPILAKGDYEGHPFRGNQWVDASGARPAFAIPDNGVDFNPYSAEAKDYSEMDRRNERIEFSANASVAFDDARQADLLRLNDLRGVGIIEVPAPADKTNPRRYRLVVRLGGYDTTLVLDSLKEHRNFDEALKRKPKVQELLEEFVNNPTLKVRAIDADVWEYEYVAQSGPNKGRTITKRTSFVKPQYSQQPDVVLKSLSVTKGDYVGHPFRGNQWMDANGVPRGESRSGESIKIERPEIGDLVLAAEHDVGHTDTVAMFLTDDIRRRDNALTESRNQALGLEGFQGEGTYGASFFKHQVALGVAETLSSVPFDESKTAFTDLMALQGYEDEARIFTDGLRGLVKIDDSVIVKPAEYEGMVSITINGEESLHTISDLITDGGAILSLPNPNSKIRGIIGFDEKAFKNVLEAEGLSVLWNLDYIPESPREPDPRLKDKREAWLRAFKAGLTSPNAGQDIVVDVSESFPRIDGGLEIRRVEDGFRELSRIPRNRGENIKSLYLDLGNQASRDLQTLIPNGLVFDKETVVGYGLATQLVGNWAKTANDSHVVAHLIQDVARQEFGLEQATDWSTKTMTLTGEPQIQEQSRALLKQNGPLVKTIGLALRSMHDATQRHFEAQGIQYVLLYRGEGDTPDSTESDSLTTQVNQLGNIGKGVTSIATTRPLSSWAATVSTAEQFSYGSRSAIARAIVPIQDILSIPSTGFGCFDEDEFVVLGRPRMVDVNLASTMGSRASLAVGGARRVLDLAESVEMAYPRGSNRGREMRAYFEIQPVNTGYKDEAERATQEALDSVIRQLEADPNTMIPA